MDKISLEEFRRVRDIIGEVFELIKTHDENYDFRDDIEKKYPNIDEILEEYEALGKKDLSDIPFEEYKGFYDAGIDFEDSGAKLDFNYIDISNREGPVRVKGCEVRNFPFTPGLYDEDSFDEDFLNQFSDKFLSIDLPKDVSGRYYVGELTIPDVLQYNLFDAIEEGKTTKETKDFFNRVDINLIRSVRENLLNNFSIAGNLSYYVSKIEGEVTEEKYREALKQAIENLIERSYIGLNEYDEVTHLEGIEEFYPSEKIIDFKGNEKLYENYRSGFLETSQIVENKEIFRGKKFVSKLYDFLGEKTEYTEEQVYFILDNYPELAEVLARDTRLLPRFFTKVNLEEDVEENKRRVREEALEIYNDRSYEYFSNVKSEMAKILSIDDLAKTLGEYDKQYYDTLRERYSEEEISKYEIPNDILFNHGVLSTLNTLGLDEVMEFDANNDHIFSKNNYLLLRIMDDYYFHYSGNNHDSNTNLYTPINQGDMDEFFKRMIKYGPTDYNYKEQPIDFRNFSDEFKSKYPELFISEEAPEELKDLFYSRNLKVTDFKDHSEWIKYFEKTDLNIGMKIEGINFSNSRNSYNFSEILDLVANNGIEKIEYLLDLEEKGYLDIYRRAPYKFDSISITDEELQDISYEKITEKFEVAIENAIKKQPSDFRDFSDEFKSKYPNIFIPEEAPEELKDLYYQKNLKISDIKEHSDWIQYLDKVELTLGMKSEGVDFLASNKYLKYNDMLDLVTNSNAEKIEYLLQLEEKGYLDIYRRFTHKFDAISITNEELQDFSLEKLTEKFELAIEIAIKKKPSDFRDFSDEFKSKYPNIFIPEEAPEELKDLYYLRKLKAIDFKEHSDWIQYMDKVELPLGMEIKGIDFLVSNKYYNYSQILDLLTDSNAEKIEYLIGQEEKDYVKIFRKFPYSLSRANITQDELEEMSFAKLGEKFDQEVEREILQGRIPYGENFVTNRFRENHPELMLSPDAPEELKKKYYTYYELDGENVAKTNSLTILDWLDKENYEYLEGKKLSYTAIASLAPKVNEALKMFSREELEKMVLIDQESMIFYLKDLNLLNKFSSIIQKYPDKFAKEAVSEELKIPVEELESRLESGDNDIVLKVEDEKQKYLTQLIKSPGYVLDYPDEEKNRRSLKEYRNLSDNNMLKVSNRYVMETYEQILVNAYKFLGFDEARKLLEVPDIDDETLDRIYEQDELIKSLYEKKFAVKGDLKVVSKLVEHIPAILPGNNEKLTTKNTLKVFKGINDEIQNGYDGDIQALLIKVLEKNNMSIDEEKIDELSKALIAISTAQKLELVREKNANVIDERINENDGTRRLIKILYRNAMEYSLSNSEKINPSLVREYLEKEFSKLNENGLPYYSPHVREHLEEYVEMSKELNESETWSKKLNHTIVDDIRSQAHLIGKGWIRKIVNYACNQPENLTYEEITKMEELLYPEESNVEIEADSIVTVKNLSQEEKEKTYRLLSSGNYAGLLTYSKAENMFSTRNAQYSQLFREFFVKHKEAFITNPKLYTSFQLLNNRFDSILENENIRSSFEAGKLDPEDVLLTLESEPYPTVNTRPGDDEMIYLAKNAHLAVEQVTKALELMEKVRAREYQTIPPEETIIDEYRGKILRIDDPRHFTVGDETNCCQKFGNGQPGESSMLHSATERNGSEFIIEKIDSKGDSKAIMSQSWVWRNGNRVTFDNVEIPNDIQNKLLVEGGFDKLMDIYIEAAKKIVETDRRKLKELVEQGKISEEQARTMEIKEVTMGESCDDLIVNISKEKRQKLPEATSVIPIEKDKTYVGFNARTLYTDAYRSLVIYHNDDFEENDHEHVGNEVSDVGVRYYKSRDVLRRSGLDIKQDAVKKIEDRGLTKEDSMLQVLNPLDSGFVRRINIPSNSSNLSMSESADWYILYDKSDDEYKIYEGNVDQSEPKSNIDKMDRKMALGEFTREMYGLFLEAAKEKKSVKILSDDLLKILPVEVLKKDGILNIGEDSITVMDDKKLEDKLLELNQILEGQRRDRILISQDKEDKDETVLE